MTDFITAIKQKPGFYKKEPSGADVRINTMLKEVVDILEAGFANAKAKFALSSTSSNPLISIRNIGTGMEMGGGVIYVVRVIKDSTKRFVWRSLCKP
jgi:hypothetical protein